MFTASLVPSGNPSCTCWAYSLPLVSSTFSDVRTSTARPPPVVSHLRCSCTLNPGTISSSPPPPRNHVSCRHSTSNSCTACSSYNLLFVSPATLTDPTFKPVAAHRARFRRCLTFRRLDPLLRFPLRCCCSSPSYPDPPSLPDCGSAVLSIMASTCPARTQWGVHPTPSAAER